jgi:hypothetical protein
MDTSLLNQYVFADLVDRHAQKVRAYRLEKNPESSNALTEEDIKEAIKNLNWIRLQAIEHI